MANTYTGNADAAQLAQMARVRALVLWLSLSAVLTLVAGVALALFVDGPARLWVGLPYVMAMGLAIVVGLSKTSSA